MRYLVGILSVRPCGFCQLLQLGSGIVPLIRPWLLLLKSCYFISHAHKLHPQQLLGNVVWLLRPLDERKVSQVKNHVFLLMKTANMTDSRNTFPNNNLYLLWNQRERESNGLVQTYTVGGHAVKKSHLKCILAKSVMRIEHCTWKIVGGGWVYCANRDNTWVNTIYKNFCVFFVLPERVMLLPSQQTDSVCSFYWVGIVNGAC
jgi:hypothetical protein